MSIEITKNTAGKWLAWCEDCQDGWQGTNRTANKWAEKRMMLRHAA